MPGERIFLGWDRPCLHVAVDELNRRFLRDGVLDLEQVIIALPGARAGRRLIELLVESAERDGLRLVPPLVATPGSLPEWLGEAGRPMAGDVAGRLAWVHALNATEPGVLEQVFPRRPEADDFEGWFALAGMCEKLHVELAGEMLTFADVAKKGSELPDFHEEDRWLALETVRRLYVARLDELGLADRHELRIESVKNRTCRTEKTIVLLATPELNGVVRVMLSHLADRVSVWMFAPLERAEWFDEFGCTRVKPWQEATIELGDDQVEMAERPGDQAAAVLRAIAGFDQRFAATEITVGVPDEEVVPYIEQQFEQIRLAAHHAAGLSVRRTGLFRLLEVVADYVERHRADDFAAIVRHPAVEEWLRANTTNADWIAALDKFAAERLAATLPPDSFRDFPADDPLRQVYERVEVWLKVMTGSRPLADWAEPIQELLLTVYGIRQFNRNVPHDRIVIETCDKIHEVLRQLYVLDPRSRPSLPAAAALRLVLRIVQGETIAVPPRRDSIELLGWLELPLDDAPALIVTGFNEGFVPDSINDDAFLPNQLRRHLGLLDNDRRYARDAYVLSAILASHAEKGIGSLLCGPLSEPSRRETPRPFFRSVKLIAGRCSGNFEPLTPSRLLFACDDELIARRIRRFFPEDIRAAAPATIERLVGSAHSSVVLQSQFVIPKIGPPAKPITSMKVTSFRDYLACPYRFFLRHVLKLKAVEVQDEMDPLSFGTLAHDVLKKFGSEPIRDSDDAEAIREFLAAELDAKVKSTFRANALPAVRVQIEQLRLRLDAFARVQAKRRTGGWKIERTEHEFHGPRAAIVVDGEPMLLRGRIDRIDQNEKTGAFCVLDYKTSEDGDTPEKTHVKGGQWKDLQLPLYRRLVQADRIADEMSLGYIVLPRDPAKVEFVEAKWVAEDLAQADAVADDVVRKVRRGEFGEPTIPPPRGFDEFAWICQEGRTAPSIEDDGDEEEGNGE